jgi:hypothetical protein
MMKQQGEAMADDLTHPPHLDEGTLHAWLDGALSEDEQHAVEAHVASCDLCAAKTAEARGLIAASSRILSSLDDVPRNVVPGAGDGHVIATPRVGARSIALRYGPIAAVAIFALGATLVLNGRRGAKSPASALGRAPAESSSVAAADSVRNSAPFAPLQGAAQSSNEARTAVRSGKPSGTAPSKAAPSAVAPSAVPPSTAASSSVATADAASKAAKPPASTDVALSTDMARAATTPFASRARIMVQPALPAPAVTATTRRLDSPLNTMSVAAEAATGANALLAQVADSAAPTMTGATVISTTQSIENVMRVRTTVFQLDSGPIVTLIERRSLAPEAAAAVSHDARTNSLAVAAHASALVERPSVSWLGHNGATFTLTGPLSATELQELRKRIVE